MFVVTINGAAEDQVCSLTILKIKIASMDVV